MTGHASTDVSLGFAGQQWDQKFIKRAHQKVLQPANASGFSWGQSSSCHPWPAWPLQHFLVANFLMGCHLCGAAVGVFYLCIRVETAIAVQKVLLVMPIEITLNSPKQNIKQEQCYQVMFKPIHKPSLIVEKWKVCCEKPFYAVENTNTTCWGWNSPRNKYWFPSFLMYEWQTMALRTLNLLIVLRLTDSVSIEFLLFHCSPALCCHLPPPFWNIWGWVFCLFFFFSFFLC